MTHKMTIYSPTAVKRLNKDFCNNNCNFIPLEDKVCNKKKLYFKLYVQY